MPDFGGTSGNDLILGGSGADRMAGGAGNDTYVVDDPGDTIEENADVAVAGQVSWWGTTSEFPVTLVRVSTTEFVVRIQLAGQPDGIFSEFALVNVRDGIWGINRLSVADSGNQMPTRILSSSDSVWEYAFTLARADHQGGSGQYGGAHGNQISRQFGLSLDGIDLSALPLGAPVNGSSLTVEQKLDIILPADGTTIAGSVLLDHIFDQSGMTIHHEHSYAPGFELFGLIGSYSAMLPTTGAMSGGIDMMQVGDNDPRSITYTGVDYDFGTHAGEARAWGTEHNYMVTLSLPSGGPDLTDNWTHSSGIWIRDFASTYAKIYVNWVERGPVPAVDSAHEAHYSVGLRDPGLPSEISAPTAPRAVGQGVDTVLASITYTLPPNVEILRLTGSENIAGYGNALNNSLVGNAGNNTLDGAGGDNLLWGGLGDDLYIVRGPGDQVFEQTGEGFDTILTALAAYALPDNVEGLIFTSGANAVGVGNALANLLRGGDGDDRLSGMQGDDEIHGGGGNDYLVGGTGADALFGDAGDDILDGRGGVSRMEGGAGNDLYVIDGASDEAIERAGQGRDEIWTDLAAYTLPPNVEDMLYVGTGNFSGSGNDGDNTIRGGAGNDVLAGFAGDDLLIGGAGDNILIGGAGRNILLGGSGSDVLDGRGGINTLQGGDGDDVYLISSAADTIIEAAGGGRDLIRTNVSYKLSAVQEIERLSADDPAATTALDLTGNALAQVITGNAGANSLTGGGGGDYLLGLGGDDVLVGSADAPSTLEGGAGNDYYYVSRTGDSLVERAGEGYDRVLASVSFTLSAGQAFELLRAADIAATSALNLTGNGLAQTIEGNAGPNVLTGGGGKDDLIGLGGDDILVGNADASSTLQGGTGNDWYYISRTGDSIVEFAGEGNDRILTGVSYALSAGQEIETLSAASAAAATPINLTGNAIAQVISGNAGANVLTGGGGSDYLVGLGGDDILVGNADAASTLQGGTGNDWYYVFQTGDSIVELAGQGNDRISTTVSYTLSAGAEVETLAAADQSGTAAIDLVGNDYGQLILGTNGANGLSGNGGADRIAGLGGDDVILGGDGDDQLNGGAGHDVLNGGGGADLFVFADALGPGNVDLIQDFASGTDRIALDHGIFTGLSTGALSAAAFVAGSAAQDADDRILYNRATGELWFDPDGNGAGAAMLFATLANQPTITASDLVVI